MFLDISIPARSTTEGENVSLNHFDNNPSHIQQRLIEELVEIRTIFTEQLRKKDEQIEKLLNLLSR